MDLELRVLLIVFTANLLVQIISVYKIYKDHPSRTSPIVAITVLVIILCWVIVNLVRS